MGRYKRHKRSKADRFNRIGRRAKKQFVETGNAFERSANAMKFFVDAITAGLRLMTPSVEFEKEELRFPPMKIGTFKNGFSIGIPVKQK